MRHRKKVIKLHRKKEHREAMLRNLATSLVLHSKITTTITKAKALKRVIERLVSKAKKGDLATRRHLLGYLYKKEAVKKLMDEIAPRFKDREGGYVRIIRLGFRKGDCAEMARIEFIDTQSKEEKKNKKEWTPRAEIEA